MSGAPRRGLTAQDKIHLEKVYNGLNRGYLKPHGVHPSVRHALAEYGERYLYCRVDHDLEASRTPPPEVEAAMLDVFGRDRIFGPDGKRKLMVRMHPQLNRWCFWERRLDPSKGENYWKVIFVHQEEPKDDTLPHDILELHEKKRMFIAHLYGHIGEYRLPNREDFIRIERTDKRKYGWENVEEHFHQQDEASKAEAIYENNQLIEEIVDYAWEAERDLANQQAGSGQRMASYATVEVKKDPEKWAIEQRNGFTVRKRKSLDERLGEIADAVIEADRRLVEERGMNRRRTPEQIAAAEASRKQELDSLVAEILEKKPQAEPARAPMPVPNREAV